MSKRFQGGILGAGFDPLKAPNAPTGVTASGESGAASVSFTAPSNVGGSAVSSYAVVASPGGIGASGTASPITVSGLTNGTTYTFSVAAINSYGFSPYSGTVTATAGLFVEDVFSTYLYTGTGTTPQTITNGIDLAGKGGAVWVKCRDTAGYNNWISGDGNNNGLLCTNTTSAAIAGANAASSWQYTSTGMNILSSALSGAGGSVNGSGKTFTSWTFRKAPKFFDVVTYTGTGSARTIAHSLGVAPGCIIVKRTDTTSNWAVYHRGQTSASFYTKLNLTDAQASDSTVWNGTAPTDTAFSVGTSTLTNASGGTYVAYLFAHDATADGIIQCGEVGIYGNTVNLGWEPQWILLKGAGTASDWYMFDTMRGITYNFNGSVSLLANGPSAESGVGYIDPLTNGFEKNLAGSYIYIAIRRGPMKTPTVGTSVLTAGAGVNNFADNGSITTLKNDLYIYRPYRTATTAPSWLWADRLRGYPTAGAPILNSSTTDAESSRTTAPYIYGDGTAAQIFSPASGNLVYRMARAPGFFDVVCYTGTGIARTVNHNLGVAPELMIVRARNLAANWAVYHKDIAATRALFLNSTAASDVNNGFWNSTAPTASVFTVGSNGNVNEPGGYNYVAYLFASCPGVSKVGSYTGNGTSQTINCGFSNGARFFLVKRTDSTGDWWVYDSARGIVAAADPALRLNSTAAEVTSADAVDTESTGIIVNQETTCNINVNGATYIFLAIS